MERLLTLLYRPRSTPRIRTLLLILPALLSSCRSISPPDIEPLSTAWTREGSALSRNGSTAQARRAFLRAVHIDDKNVPAQERLQDLDLRRLGRSKNWKSWREQILGNPDLPGHLLYLGVRAAPDSLPPIQKKTVTSWLRNAIQKSPWVASSHRLLATHHIASQAFEDAEDSLQILRQLAPEDPRTWDLSGYVAFRSYNWPLAMRHFRRCLRLDPRKTRPRIFLTIDLMAQRRHLEAVESFESIDRWSPTYRWRWDEQYAYRTAWKRTLSRFREDGQFAIGLLLSRRAATRWPHPDLWAHHGYFAGALGRSQESESAYRKALQIDPYHLESSRGLRRILFQQGQIENGLSRWKKTHLVHRILEKDNLVAKRYQALLDRGHALESDPSPENRLEWARSLGRAGWLEEASDAYRSLPPAFRQRHSREMEDLRAFRGWIHALHGLFLDIYRRRARGETTPSYSRIRQRMQVLCPERFGLDIEADLKNYYAVFSESDPFHPQPGGLGQLLDRYNYFADLHNGTGEPELRLMHRLEHRRVQDRLFSGLDGRFEVLISDRTLIPSFSEYLWGDLRLSGRAFLSRRGFYLCVDTLQPSLPGLKRLIERTRKTLSHNPNIRGVTWDPAAARILERRHLAESLLLDPNSTREPRWDEMHRRQLQARLDNVWYHELGHIADFHHYVPMYAHLLRNLGMALSQGFSPGKIHTRFEEIAETYSLARSPHTPLILLDNLRRLHLDPDSLLYRLHVAWQETSPEDSPYTRAANHIFTRLGHSKRSSRKVESIPYQLSRTDSEKIRKRTRELLARDDLD